MISKILAWIMAVVYMWQRRRTDRPGWDVQKKPSHRDDPQLVVKRRWFSDKTTIGELFIDGSPVRKCYILEDTVRDPAADKVPGRTAIPEGTFEVIISYSNKFKQHMPLLLNVPNFRGIRIHPGNTNKDTAGCLLPGMDKTEDNRTITYSRKTYQDLYALLKVMTEHEKVYMRIQNDRQA